MIGHTFGFTNGIITMLALITGLYATKVNKVGIIGAILALLITDPLSDAYSMYSAQKISDKKNAFNIGKNAFISQVLLQTLFLTIIIISPTIEQGIFISYIIGILLTIIYDKYKNIPTKDTLNHLFIIFFLVFLTYYIDTYLYKYFDK